MADLGRWHKGNERFCGFHVEMIYVEHATKTTATMTKPIEAVNTTASSGFVPSTPKPWCFTLGLQVRERGKPWLVGPSSLTSAVNVR